MTYRPDPAVVPAPAEVVGDLLVVPDGAILPEICLACGAHGPGVDLRTGPREVVWMPGVLVVAWFLNPVLGLLAVALLRRKAVVVSSLCLACTRRRLDGFALHRALFAGAVVTFFASVVALLNEHPVVAVAIAVGGGLGGWGFWQRAIVDRVLDIAWIHADGTVAFRKIAPAAQAACAAKKLAPRA